MNHTQIQGPYDSYACKECTEDLIHDLRIDDTFDEQLIGNYDQAYVPYPCPTTKENNEVLRNHSN